MKINYQCMTSNWNLWAPGKHVPRIGEIVTIRNGAKVIRGKVLFVDYCYTSLMDDPIELNYIKITLDWKIT